MDMFMGKSMCVMVILRMDGRIWEQRIILIGLRLNTSLDKIIEYGKSIIL
ncbi:hypothetical protein P786_1216 [Enterococcus faecalis MD6]|nr:hypothetical protein [Enterococcus faecalis]KAJ71229.1 hypothetical protein P786_1216 [Enterococcus faecalis MD6]